MTQVHCRSFNESYSQTDVAGVNRNNPSEPVSRSCVSRLQRTFHSPEGGQIIFPQECILRQTYCLEEVGSWSLIVAGETRKQFATSHSNLGICGRTKYSSLTRGTVRATSFNEWFASFSSFRPSWRAGKKFGRLPFLSFRP